MAFQKPASIKILKKHSTHLIILHLAPNNQPRLNLHLTFRPGHILALIHAIRQLIHEVRKVSSCFRPEKRCEEILVPEEPPFARGFDGDFLSVDDDRGLCSALVR